MKTRLLAIAWKEKALYPIACGLLLGLAACAHDSKPGADPKATVIPDKLYPVLHKEEGAIWPGETSGNMLFEDTKGKQLGDIITITVDENATSTQTATTSTKKSTTFDLSTGRLLGLPSNLGIGNLLGSGNAFNPNIDAKTSKSNDGQGTTTRKGNLTASISAVITEVLPSGNFRVEGKRVVTINNEDQILVIKGIVRPVDINFDNTISSKLIADAEITYVGKGIIADEQSVGWATRVLGWVWPF